MSYRKATLRNMPPYTRRLARLVGELDSVSRRLKNILPELQSLELWYRADQKRQAHYGMERSTTDETLSHS